MIHDYHKDRSLPEGILYNADTGERIPLAYWFDDETGEYRHYEPDINGKIQLDPADRTKPLGAYGRCRRLLFVPFDSEGKAPFPTGSVNFREFL